MWRSNSQNDAMARKGCAIENHLPRGTIRANGQGSKRDSSYGGTSEISVITVRGEKKKKNETEMGKSAYVLEGAPAEKSSPAVSPDRTRTCRASAVVTERTRTPRRRRLTCQGAAAMPPATIRGGHAHT